MTALRRPPRITTPQWDLYQEIAEVGILYISRNHQHYSRTIGALRRRGLVECVEPDYSRTAMDGWSVAKA